MNKKFLIPITVIIFMITVWGCDDDPTTVIDHRFSSNVENSFVVGQFSTLAVENYVGNVTIKPGAAGVIIIVATKWADHEEDLSKIGIKMTYDSNIVEIVADDPSDVEGGEVDFEITASPDARVMVYNGVGSINYTGRAEGFNMFDNGVGGIQFNLPSDINIEVELSTGVGTIYLDFPVNGLVNQRAVNGIVGTGADGELYAEVGVGNIRLNQQ